jgi:hypothetical protein
VLDDRTTIRGANVKPGVEVDTDVPVYHSQVWERIKKLSFVRERVRRIHVCHK